MLLERISAFFKELEKLAKLGDAKSIARRLFVTNSFDAMFSALGVMLGTYAVGAKDPTVYIGAILGGSLSMGLFSSFVGSYLAERAERLRELKSMEREVMASLRKSIYWRASRVIPLYVAFWSSIGIIALPLLSTTPFMASWAGLLSLDRALTLSVAIVYAIMFSLGAYLGKVSGESMVRTGLKMLGITVAATAFLLMVRVAVALGPSP